MNSLLGKSPSEGRGESVRSVPAELGIDLLETTNEVEDFFSIPRTASGLAKVSAATERAGGIDKALLGLGLKERAGAVGGCGQMLTSGGAKSLGGDEGFPASQEGCFSGQLEVATFASTQALANGGSLGEVLVDGADAGKDGFHRG